MIQFLPLVVNLIKKDLVLLRNIISAQIHGLFVLKCKLQGFIIILIFYNLLKKKKKIDQEQQHVTKMIMIQYMCLVGYKKVMKFHIK